MSSSWLAALENVGAALAGAPASLVTAAQNELNAIMGGVKSKVTPMLNTITAEYASPDVVVDMVKQIKEVPNLPATASVMVGTIPALAAAAAADATKLQALLGVVNAIEQQL
jgi:hypothetical protein